MKEKNEILGEKEALMLDNEKLKYSLASLEETVARLKNEKMAMAREKEAAAKLNYLEKTPDGTSSGKFREKDSLSKEREYELRRTLENYEERHSSLTLANRKLEEQLNQL
jgi:folylpolyglutamate synthase/dihydropteroate synthase